MIPFTKIKEIGWFEIGTKENKVPWYIRAEEPAPDGRNLVTVNHFKGGPVVATGFLKLTDRNSIRIEDLKITSDEHFPRSKLERTITWMLRDQEKMREKDRG